MPPIPSSYNRGFAPAARANKPGIPGSYNRGFASGAQAAGRALKAGKPVAGTAPGSRPGHVIPAKQPPAQPYDPAYQAYVAQQNRNFALTSAENAYQVGRLAYSTGFNQNGTLNESNPYSEAALLKENFNRSMRGTMNSYASQGQLYSGAYGRMQDENARNYSIGYNTLSNNTANSYHNLAAALSQAAANAGAGLSDQARLALFRALYPSG